MKTLSAEKKTVVTNFFSLSFLQAANYIFPLLTLPYLVRVLGVERFGLIAFASAVVQYCIIFTEYGFPLSATREVSIHREDKDKLSRIFSSVTAIRICLIIVSFCAMMIFVMSVARFRSEWLLFVLSFGLILDGLVFPVWFFQGMERMKYITMRNVIAKSIVTLSIFVFIRSQKDYLLVPLINSLGFVAAGSFGLWTLFRHFGVKLIFDPKQIWHQWAEGWHLFLSRMAMSLYVSSSPLILGLLANNAAVGYYSAVERLIRAAQNLFMPLTDALYPYMNKIAVESKEKALRNIRKLISFIGIGSGCISIVFFLLAGSIVHIVLGRQYQQSIAVMKILAFLPFFANMITVLGSLTMLVFNMKKEFSRIIIVSGFLHIAMSLILVPMFQHVGMAISLLITEVFIASAMFLRLKGTYI